MKILALDPGTKCGWAITGACGSRYSSGVWNLKPNKFDSGGMRFVELYTKITNIISDVDLIAYERVERHSSTYAAHVYGVIISVIQGIGEEYLIPYKGIPVGTIKKHATGKGSAKKEAMVLAAQARFRDVDIKDDNHADALCILAYAHDTYEDIFGEFNKTVKPRLNK